MMFSERSKQLRKHFSLTQEEMAERFGVTRAYYGLLESDKKEPSETLLKMLSLLELSAQVHGNLDRFGKVEEEKGIYLSSAVERDDDPQVNRLIEYTHELVQLARRCDADTKGYILTQLRLHLPLDSLETMTPPAGAPRFVPQLTENPDVQERRPSRESRPGARMPGVHPETRHGDEKASGG